MVGPLHLRSSHPWRQASLLKTVANPFKTPNNKKAAFHLVGGGFCALDGSCQIWARVPPWQFHAAMAQPPTAMSQASLEALASRQLMLAQHSMQHYCRMTQSGIDYKKAAIYRKPNLPKVLIGPSQYRLLHKTRNMTSGDTFVWQSPGTQNSSQLAQGRCSSMQQPWRPNSP